MHRLVHTFAYFWNWLKRHGMLESTVLLSLFAVAASLWGFFEIADEVHEEKSHYLDEWLLHALRQSDNLAQPLGPRWLVHGARDMTALGSGTVITLLSFYVAGFLALRRKWGALCFVAASVSTGALMNDMLKAIFARARPALVPHLTEVSSLSFPSGHSMNAAIIYLTLGALLARATMDFRLKIYFLTCAGLLVLMIGTTRIYLGVHFPSDVLAGWCAGTAWALLCNVVMRWLQQKGVVEQEVM